MSNPDLKPVETKPDLSPEEMKSILQADRLAREQRTAARIRKVLEEERCVMNPVMMLSNGNVSGRIEIKAQD